jgi:hypothetical protein
LKEFERDKAVDILIEELIMWMEIQDFSKIALETDPTSWQALTQCSMASKQIQTILTKLNLTPQERMKKIKNDEKVATLDLNKFLSDDSKPTAG